MNNTLKVFKFTRRSCCFEGLLVDEGKLGKFEGITACTYYYSILFWWLEQCKHLFCPLRLETVCHVLRKQLFAGIIFPCVLTYKLRIVLNELQWHALLNGPVFRVYIAFLREISEDNGCNRWLLCGGYAALCMQA